MVTKKLNKRASQTVIPRAVRSFIPGDIGYVARQLTPEWTDAEFLDFVWQANQHAGFCQSCGTICDEGDKCCETPEWRRHSRLNVAITGPTGAGKTSGLVDFAYRHGLPMFTVSYMTNVHSAFGQYVPDPDTGGLRWVKGPAWMIADHGGVLYLDEINFLDASVQAGFFSTLDFRQAITLMEHPIKAHCPEHGDLMYWVDPLTGTDHRQCDGVEPWDGPYQIKLNAKTLVCSSFNPVGEYAGTNHLNAALANRFVTLHYDYSRDVEGELLMSPSMAAFGNALRTSVRDRVRTPVSTNRLIEFERLIVETGDYPLAKTLFLGNFPGHEQPEVRQVLEDAFEQDADAPDGGIFGAFNIDVPDEDDEIIPE